MLVLVIWWNPKPRKPGVWSELLLEPFENWDVATKFVHERKRLNGATKFQMRNLDPLLRTRGIRAIPQDFVQAMIDIPDSVGEMISEGGEPLKALLENCNHTHVTIDIG